MHFAIVLAAGRSRRMGRQKLLLPVGGVPVVTRVVDALLTGQVDRVFVVVGSDREAVRKSLAGRDVEFVVNDNPESDMLDSVRCGLSAVPADCKAVLVALGDQPGLEPDVVAALIHESAANDRGIIVPTFGGRRGHPLLFSICYRDEILKEYARLGLRGLLLAHPEEVRELEVTSASILEDIDEPGDYARHVGDASPGAR